MSGKDLRPEAAEAAERVERVNRRGFLKATAGLAAVAATGLVPARAGEPRPVVLPSHGGGLIDTNVTLGQWPFRRVPLDETPRLVSKLRRAGVVQAWAGTYEGLLHKDLGSANARLVADCRRHGHGVLLPFGSVDPLLPDWEEELRRCQEVHRMRGIRLFPNYHGYHLEDRRFGRLLQLAAGRGLLVQLAVLMEDERMQHPLVRVPHVDTKPLVDLLRTLPQARVLLLNWSRGVPADLLPKLAGTGQVSFEISSVESVGGVARLLGEVPAQRVLFGSNAPFFYFESAALKLQESELSEAELGAVCAGNAKRLLG